MERYLEDFKDVDRKSQLEIQDIEETCEVIKQQIKANPKLNSVMGKALEGVKEQAVSSKEEQSKRLKIDALFQNYVMD